MTSVSTLLAVTVLLGGAVPNEPGREDEALSPSASRVASADSKGVASRLQRAQALADDLEYEQALEALLEIITSGEASDAQLVVAHFRAGLICRLLNRDVEAKAHLSWAFRRSPDLQAPPGTAPKIQAFVELIREDIRVENELRSDAKQVRADRKEAQHAAQQAEPEPSATATPEEKTSLFGWTLIGGGLGGFAFCGLGLVAAAAAWVGAYSINSQPTMPGAYKAVARPVGIGTSLIMPLLVVVGAVSVAVLGVGFAVE